MTSFSIKGIWTLDRSRKTQLKFALEILMAPKKVRKKFSYCPNFGELSIQWSIFSQNRINILVVIIFTCKTMRGNLEILFYHEVSCNNVFSREKAGYTSVYSEISQKRNIFRKMSRIAFFPNLWFLRFKKKFWNLIGEFYYHQKLTRGQIF